MLVLQTLFSLIFLSSNLLFLLLFILSCLDLLREIILLQENFKVSFQISKLNLLVINKIYCITYIYYLFTLCKLSKIIMLIKIN